MPSFAEAAARVVEQERAGWRTPTYGREWMLTFERYALPRIGRVPVSEVTSADVLEILTPIWHAKAETARRLRKRIRAVLEWAVAMEFRIDNPCDRIGPVLGSQGDVVRHMPRGSLKRPDRDPSRPLQQTLGHRHQSDPGPRLASPLQRSDHRRGHPRSPRPHRLPRRADQPFHARRSLPSHPAAQPHVTSFTRNPATVPPPATGVRDAPLLPGPLRLRSSVRSRLRRGWLGEDKTPTINCPEQQGKPERCRLDPAAST